MKFEVTIRMTVEAATAIDAHETGLNATQHLIETFNDDKSIESVFAVHAQPMKDQSHQRSAGRAS